mmetsp:Transcript_63250/g.120651  ORF Transcript_63250/g.120651 Transcript_63250/m.120651 type:complete len:125 (-) Transcript_63250:727-1101(-)
MNSFVGLRSGDGEQDALNDSISAHMPYHAHKITSHQDPLHGNAWAPTRILILWVLLRLGALSCVNNPSLWASARCILKFPPRRAITFFPTGVGTMTEFLHFLQPNNKCLRTKFVDTLRIQVQVT